MQAAVSCLPPPGLILATGAGETRSDVSPSRQDQDTPHDREDDAGPRGGNGNGKLTFPFLGKLLMSKHSFWLIVMIRHIFPRGSS